MEAAGRAVLRLSQRGRAAPEVSTEPAPVLTTAVINQDQQEAPDSQQVL